jgi:hypothetical protein
MLKLFTVTGDIFAEVNKQNEEKKSKKFSDLWEKSKSPTGIITVLVISFILAIVFIYLGLRQPRE